MTAVYGKGILSGLTLALVGRVCGDACVTFAVGKRFRLKRDRLDHQQKNAWQGIEASQIGNRLGDIGQAIQNHAEAHGYSVVKEWGGHGIGRDLRVAVRTAQWPG